MDTQRTIDAGILSKTQSTGVTQWVSQHMWKLWIDVVSDQI